MTLDRACGFGRLRVTHAPVMCTRSDGSKELVRAFPPFHRRALIDQLRELHAPLGIVTDNVPLLDVYHRVMTIAACFGTASPHDATLRRLIATTRECNYMAAAHIVASILVCRKMDIHWPNEPPHVTAFLDRLTKTFQTPQMRGLSSSDIQLLNVCCVVLATDPQWADVVTTQHTTSFVPSPTGQPGRKRQVDTGSGSSASPAATRPRIDEPEQKDPTTRDTNTVLPPGLIDELLRFMTDELALRYIEATSYTHVVGTSSASAASHETKQPENDPVAVATTADTNTFRGMWLRYRIKKRVAWELYDGPYIVSRVLLTRPTTQLPRSVYDIECIEDWMVRNLHRSTTRFSQEALDRAITANPFNQEPFILPSTITHFTMSNAFTGPLRLAEPSQLVALTMGTFFNDPTFRLPPTVKQLVMGDVFNQPGFVAPEGLVELTMGLAFNQHGFKLPTSIRKCNMGVFFDAPDFVLPPHLTHFRYGPHGTKSDWFLPRSLTHLDVGTQRSFSFDPDIMLEVLYVYVHYGGAPLSDEFETQLPAHKRIAEHKKTYHVVTHDNAFDWSIPSG